ncbi:hypothetical protein [Bradyrhizobium sp. STM 3562]|uniref:hypothetical protein n=1 Tax=Bradyrhizobium sp. STM 3562 TaxID=578924 RepID=UPI00388FFFEA
MNDRQPPFEERKWKHELEIERQKWLFETNRDDAHRAHDQSREFHTYVNQSAIEGANLALKTLILINGGAAVAILTFLGALAAKDKADFVQIGNVAHTLRDYAIGVALALAAMALAYLTNYFLAGQEGRKSFHYDHPFIRETTASRKYKLAYYTSHALAFLCAMLSLIAFIVGMWTTSDRVTKIIERPSSAIVAD